MSRCVCVGVCAHQTEPLPKTRVMKIIRNVVYSTYIFCVTLYSLEHISCVSYYLFFVQRLCSALSFTNRKSDRRWMTCEGHPCLSAHWRRSLTITTPSCQRRSAANTTSASCHSLTKTHSSPAAPSCSIIRFVFNLQS